MNQRGFTMIELAIVITIAAIMLPLLYGFAWHVERQLALAQWTLEAADGVRTLSEELRLDARAGKLAQGPDLSFEREGCSVRYTVDEARVLVRTAPDACGGTRGLVRDVGSLVVEPGGVEVTFERALRPDQVHRTSVFIPVGTP